jgi:hypothetical protein
MWLYKCRTAHISHGVCEIMQRGINSFDADIAYIELLVRQESITLWGGMQVTLLACIPRKSVKTPHTPPWGILVPPA